MAEVVPAVVRDRAMLEAARAAALDWLPDASPRAFVEGAIAAYDWLLGRSPAPISGGEEVTRRMVMREEDLADDVIYRRRGAADVRRDWAVGVQHALMWARGAADRPPVGVE